MWFNYKNSVFKYSQTDGQTDCQTDRQTQFVCSKPILTTAEVFHEDGAVVEILN